MLDSVYHMTLQLLWNRTFGVKTLRTQRYYGENKNNFTQKMYLSGPMGRHILCIMIASK